MYTAPQISLWQIQRLQLYNFGLEQSIARHLQAEFCHVQPVVLQSGQLVHLAHTVVQPQLTQPRLLHD